MEVTNLHCEVANSHA